MEFGRPRYSPESTVYCFVDKKIECGVEINYCRYFIMPHKTYDVETLEKVLTIGNLYELELDDVKKIQSFIAEASCWEANKM